MSLDPVTLSVLASALSGIAEEAGALLIRGAYSSNIKERRDCSAALFDAKGRMVAQAEHIPVHLGAMPEAVAAVIEREPEPDGEADAGTRKANFDGDWQEVPVLRRGGMGEGAKVEGPAIVEFAEATCVVRPGWSGDVHSTGAILLAKNP